MGASVDFDGTGDIVNYGDIDILEGATAFTVDMWFILDALPSESKILGEWGGSTGSQWLVDIFSAGSLQFIAQNAGNRSRYGTADSTITTGQWYHATIVWSGTTSWKLYLDGVDTTLSDKGSSGTVNSIGTGNSEYSLGGQGVFSSNLIDGRTAHVHVYDVALTHAESDELRYKPYSIVGNLLSYIPCMYAGTNKCLDIVRNDAGTISGDPTEDSDGPPVYFPGGQ